MILAFPHIRSSTHMSTPMSFPTYSFDFSNPATPGPNPWDAEQNPSIMQDPQSHSISPPSFQPASHHVSPVEEQHHQFHQQVPQAFDVPPAPQTIHLEERTGSSRYRFDNIDESHFLQHVSAGGSDPRATSKPPLRVSVDEMPRPSTSTSVSSAGPSRVLHGRARAHAQAHPYKRPQSAETGKRQQGLRSASRPRGDDEQLHERTSEMRAPGFRAPPAPSASAITMPAMGTAMGLPCPALHSWRVNQIQNVNPPERRVSGGESVVVPRYAGLSPFSGPRVSLHVSPSLPPLQPSPDPEASTPHPGSAHTPVAASQLAQMQLSHALQSLQRQRARPEPPKRFSIRADVHYDAATNSMTAMFELPGVKKTDLRITMNVCPISRVRQLTIFGKSRSILPEGGHSVQERKFGDFQRTLAIPPQTKPEDVNAVMEDGILTLRIPGGPPGEPEEAQDILIL